MSTETLVNIRSASMLAELTSPKILELILFPTEKCNFRCVYCYETFELGRMKPGLVTAIKKLIASRVADLELLKVTWFGGEPLLASDIITDICTYAQQISTASDCRFTSSMTTNGYYLDVQLLDKLARIGMWEYQITLDGDEQEHDKTRVRADGAGTFAQIWSNLLQMKSSDYDFSVILRLHYGPHNVQHFQAFLLKVLETFGDDARFCVDLQGIQHWGGPNDHTFPVIGQEDRGTLLARFRSVIGNSLPPAHGGPGSTVCYAAKGNSFIIRSDGTLGKCTVALQDERNNIGYLAEDGTLQIDQAKLWPWLRGLKTLDMEVLSCPFDGFAPFDSPATTQN